MIGQMSKKRDGFAYSADKGTILDGSQSYIQVSQWKRSPDSQGGAKPRAFCVQTLLWFFIA